jgi:predicted transcriptional regulator
MSRLTISIPDNLHNRISSLAMRNNDSMSNIINQLIQVGWHH